MTSDSVLETHALDVSRDGVFRALRAQFTSMTTFLPELLQNARRADASRVLIDWNPQHSVLVVDDDGCGIGDFRNLLVAYQSGWGSELALRESPFGVGFFAALFASEQLSIHSLDRGMVLDERSLQGAPIDVTSLPMRQGTQVRLVLKENLRRSSEEWLKMITELVMGFPVPVSFNGNWIARPHAVNSGLAFRDTDLGAVYLAGWDTCEPRTIAPLPMLYCQGLPLRRLSYSTWRTEDVLHVDARRFSPRIPDRDVLLNPKESEAAILAGVESQWRLRLRQRLQELSPADFAERYWAMCAAFEVPELLVGMPLAASMLSCYVAPEEAVDMGDEQEILDPWGARALPEEFSVLVVSLRCSYTGGEGDHPAPLASIYALERGMPVVKSNVPSTHPCWRRTVDLLDESLGLRYELNAPGAVRSFYGSWVSCEIQTCESYTIGFRPSSDCTRPERVRNQLIEITTGTWSFYDPITQRLIVPNGDQDPGLAARQLSTYLDDHDHFHEEALEADSSAISRIVASLRANSPASYLRALLDPLMPDPAALGDQAFRVQYDAKLRLWNVQPL